jgi:CYTH domain-containing protein
MPTENELKYVLRIDCEKEVAKKSRSDLFIHQGYLAFTKGMSVRVRQSIDHHTKPQYKLCFKQKVNNRVVEIEKKIDRRDYDDLWANAVNRLEKVRYNLWHEEGDEEYLWEVDFFKHDHKTYFAVAEHEMPEGQTAPDYIPSIIKENLLFAVPFIDDRFASKRLADIKYASTLYQDLLNV